MPDDEEKTLTPKQEKAFARISELKDKMQALIEEDYARHPKRLSRRSALQSPAAGGVRSPMTATTRLLLNTTTPMLSAFGLK